MLLVAINGYVIGGYSWLFYWWVLVVILLMVIAWLLLVVIGYITSIGCYCIINYCLLFYVIL